MNTRAIITTTNPDELDGDEHHALEDAHRFASIAGARLALREMVKRTNMTLYLIRVELVQRSEGKL